MNLTNGASERFFHRVAWTVLPEDFPCLYMDWSLRQGLIIVPTRELALQTSSVVKELAKYMEVQCMVTTGGTGLREDIMRLSPGLVAPSGPDHRAQ